MSSVCGTDGFAAGITECITAAFQSDGAVVECTLTPWSECPSPSVWPSS